jgi:hypothetical protein
MEFSTRYIPNHHLTQFQPGTSINLQQLFGEPLQAINHSTGSQVRADAFDTIKLDVGGIYTTTTPSNDAPTETVKSLSRKHRRSASDLVKWVTTKMSLYRSSNDSLPGLYHSVDDDLVSD